MKWEVSLSLLRILFRKHGGHLVNKGAAFCRSSESVLYLDYMATQKALKWAELQFKPNVQGATIACQSQWSCCASVRIFMLPRTAWLGALVLSCTCLQKGLQNIHMQQWAIPSNYSKCFVSSHPKQVEHCLLVSLWSLARWQSFCTTII